MHICYEDDVVVVIDKPFGLPSQAPRGGGDNAFDQLRTRVPRAALLHRLDTVASGLLLFSKVPRVNAALTRAFRAHTVVRGYRAVLAGILPCDEQSWDWPVERRRAATRVVPVGTGEGTTAVELWPQTGRKHQLRVHAAMAGVPLCGDRRYGGEAGRRWARLALHASVLAFDHPVTGAPRVVHSALPEDLAPLWEAAGGPTEPMTLVP